MLPLQQNEEKKRFEAQVEDHLLVMEYLLNTQGQIFITHTEVPEALEGRGLGGQMAEAVLGYIRDKGWKLFPMCPFLAAYIRKHPEWRDLLAPGASV